MRFAVIGDIHGNLFGLEAALADLRNQKPDGLLVTGDLVYKLPWGAEVVDLLRTLPHQAVLGNAELYLLLWQTPLWPAERWELPLAKEVVEWERARLGPERLAWLATLPEHISLSADRLEDLLVVHGVPGNPFLPLLPRPGDDRSPWVQTDARVRELMGGADADVIVCGHTHTALNRRVTPPAPDGTLIVNPGSLSYGRGKDAAPGEVSYALLDWSAAGGWRVTHRRVRFDPKRLYEALLAQRLDYPIAAYVANRMRPPGVDPVPEQRFDFIQFRWGDAPSWWEQRDALPAWRALRGE